MAIKVLPASVAARAERLARFQREAEVLAALIGTKGTKLAHYAITSYLGSGGMKGGAG